MVIVVSGTVIDEETREPIKARIQYESLPYGSKIGMLSGPDFTFNIIGENDYKLVAEADGYTKTTVAIEYEKQTDGKIEEVIVMSPTGLNKLIKLENLNFALGKSTISSSSYDELNELIGMLNDNPTMVIQLEGHTDFRGDEKANLKLSEDRVNAVRAYLAKNGTDKRRIRTKAFGGSEPLSRENTAAARKSNRRVEVRIVEN